MDTEAERQKHQFVSEKLNMAVEAGKLNLWEFDFSVGKITWTSDNTAQVFGQTEKPARWEFENFIACVHPEDRGYIHQIHQSAVESDATHFQVEYRTVWPDNSIHWVMTKGKILRDANGKALKLVGATLDITDLKVAQLSLKRLKEEAESANVAKTQFLANMSHEIRTPLAVMMGFSELLTNPNIECPRRIALAEGIERNGKVLVKLIDDILDISRVESGNTRIVIAPFDLSEFVHEIVESNQLAIQQKGIQLEVRNQNISTLVETDRSRLRQIVQNILGNAIKFTENGKVELEVRLTEEKFLDFFVRDNGFGISSDGQKVLFQPFSQVDGSSTRNFGGSGLGLAISRTLARALGGDVTLVKSQPGVGSEFQIRVSVSLFQKTVTKTPDFNRKLLRLLEGIKILVAEDNVDIQTLLTMQLEEEGAEVTVVGNGTLVMPLKNNFDIGLIDIQMPGMDGYSILKCLREKTAKLPLVAVTAHALDYEKDKCLEAGFDDYLTKPIDFQLLKKKILELVEKS